MRPMKPLVAVGGKFGYLPYDEWSAEVAFSPLSLNVVIHPYRNSAMAPSEGKQAGN